eukprot:NODE_286_length_11757_cov_0.187768.p4 type:complete len:328 gc:universal NODE_286_length_11757_cov_0.187768:6605-5622(-)
MFDFKSAHFHVKQPMFGLDFSRKSSKLAAATSNISCENEIIILDCTDMWHEYFRIPIRYPITKLQWSPYMGNGVSDLFATTSSCLNIYSGDDASHQASFGVNIPLSSMDWNVIDPSMIVTASINTTCAVWDLTVGQAKSTVIIHDKEILDVSFCANSRDTFATCGADGSIRMFDMRSLTIIYEVPNEVPLLKVDWNIIDPNYILAVPAVNNEILIIDKRYPSVPVTQLRYHTDSINDAQWCYNSDRILSCGDDSKLLVCDFSLDASYPELANMQKMPQRFNHLEKYESNPLAVISCEAPICCASWSHTDQNTVAYIVNDTIIKTKLK